MPPQRQRTIANAAERLEKLRLAKEETCDDPEVITSAQIVSAQAVSDLNNTGQEHALAAVEGHADLFDTFVSYAEEDRPIASKLVEKLRSEGVRVIWDQDFNGGGILDDTIRSAIANAKTVLVVWSSDAAQSPFVYQEAWLALKGNKLIPTHVEGFDPAQQVPMGFGHLITLPVTKTDRIVRSLAKYGVDTNH